MYDFDWFNDDEDGDDDHLDGDEGGRDEKMIIERKVGYYTKWLIPMEEIVVTETMSWS